MSNCLEVQGINDAEDYADTLVRCSRIPLSSNAEILAVV